LGIHEPRGVQQVNKQHLGAILATQAHWLTERLLDRQARDFEAGGGFSERLYRPPDRRHGARSRSGEGKAQDSGRTRQTEIMTQGPILSRSKKTLAIEV
jgi:four helix bundle suffix protein